MASYTAEDVKRLREATAAGMLDCKKALDEADGNYEKAVEIIGALHSHNVHCKFAK